MRRIVFNQKGGVGKTSITCNLAAISADRGYRTLVLDLDVQGNTSEYLLAENFDPAKESIVDYFKQSLSMFNRARHPDEFAQETPWPNLYVMPSNPELSVVERELESRHKMYKLRDALDLLERQFDHIYIDTPPALNFYSRTALIAADNLLIPFDCDSFSRQALYNLVNAVQEIREDHNAKLKIEGIVVNQFHAQASLPQQLIDSMEQDGLPVLKSFLISSVKMKESRQRHTPLIHMAASHKLTQQYIDLFEELESRATNRNGKTRS